jgi:hypothetical protein
MRSRRASLSASAPPVRIAAVSDRAGITGVDGQIYMVYASKAHCAISSTGA